MTENLELDYYNQFENVWGLANPTPNKETIEPLLQGILVVVIVGSIIVSGSRTGNVVAEIGSLNSLLTRVGLGSEFVTGLEGLLALMTVEAAILLAGYLWPSSDINEKWTYGLFAAALIPAVVTNVYPGVSGLEKLIWGTVVISKTVTDLIVGLSAPILLFVAGRVVKQTTLKLKVSNQKKSKKYGKKKRVAWLASTQYKLLRKELGLTKVPSVKASETVVAKPKINLNLYDYINGATTISSLMEKSGLTRGEVISKLDELDGKVTVMGEGVSRVTFTQFLTPIN